jgi:gamma-glutamyltranspeptidase / glutathione hydrolase / leukotriene-C4 hydrolase
VFSWQLFKVAAALVVLAVLALGVTKAIDAANKAAAAANNPAYPNAAVAADNQLCSEIGVSILKQNGSAVDAAIATTLCIGVVHPQSSGIGGGGFMLVYDKGMARLSPHPPHAL